MMMKNEGHANCSSAISAVPSLSARETSSHFTLSSAINHSLIPVFVRHLLCIKLCVEDYFVKDLMIQWKSLCTFLQPSCSYEFKFHYNRIKGIYKLFYFPRILLY